MSEIDSEAKKALVQIPKEINKLTKVIALIGETLFNAKAKKLRKNKREFEELMKQEKGDGVT